MAVGDVRGLDLGENIAIGLRIVHRPDRMRHAVRRDKVEQGTVVHILGDEFVDLRLVAVGHQNRAGLGVDRKHVAGAIVLLVRSRLLVLLDDVVVVVIQVAAADQPDLIVVVDHLAVQIQLGFILPHEIAVRQQSLEVLLGSGVHGRVVRIHFAGQVDLRAKDAQEAARVVGGELPGLLGRHDVVGDGRDLGGDVRERAKSRKRLDAKHGASLAVLG